MQYKSFMEALKGKQHKIDKNKNGKIDAQDFKILRKEETEESNESFDFNRAAIAKQRLQNLRHSGRRVRGASIANLMRSAGLREEEMDEQDLDQLDEVMAADASASDWIHDFVHSTNPKFEGKSKKERIKMALGAYYAKARSKDGEGLAEEVKTTHEDPLVTVHDKDGLHTHANLSTANHIFNTKVTHTDVHAGPVKTKDGHETKRDLTFAISKHHEIAMKESAPVAPVPDKKYIKGTPEHKAYKATKKPINGHPTNVQEGLGPQGAPGSPGPRKVDVPAYLRKQQGQTPLKLSDLKRKDTISDKDNLARARGAVDEAKKDDVPFDPPYKTVKGDGNVKDKSGAVHTPMSRTRDLARQGMKKAMKEEYGVDISDDIADQILEAAKQYAGLEKEDKPGKVKTAVVKLHPNGVGSDTVEGWKDEKKPVKEEFDEEGNLITMPKTYQEFMEGMTATQVRPGVTRYTGGSYGSAKGAKYGNTDYDKETLDTKDDEGGNEPQKRGRGRPAGAKSGARGPRIK